MKSSNIFLVVLPLKWYTKSFSFISLVNYIIVSNLYLSSLLNISLSFWWPSLLVKASSFLFWFVIAAICSFPCSSIVFVCFSNVLRRGKNVSLASYIFLLWSDDNISSPVRNSYLSIFPDDQADVFAASILISYCNFSSLILLSVVVINFYIVSKRFFRKRIKT